MPPTTSSAIPPFDAARARGDHALHLLGLLELWRKRWLVVGAALGAVLFGPSATQVKGAEGGAHGPHALPLDPETLPIMPLPQAFSLGTGDFSFARLGAVEVSGVSGPEQNRIQDAVMRLAQRWHARMGTTAPVAGMPSGPMGALKVIVQSRPPKDDWRQDEHYHLQVQPDGIALTADSAVGALRGLATLTQLLTKDSGQWVIRGGAIDDYPRFPWRGLLIDVGRHFEPVEVIERELDGMELVKLNVLHLHLTEDQGFRIESRTHPELTRMGSDGMYYTQEQMRALIRFAWARGIRVMPEFDLPGHVTALAVSHPELASAPGAYRIERKWGVFDPTLDPTNPALYPFLDQFLGEMAALFPDPFMHVGGDENDGVQWTANGRIQAFIRAHHLDGNAGLQTYFETRLSEILTREHKRMVGWDEILQPGLPADSVIESWRGADGVTAAARAGHDVILAHGYYIDLSRPASEHYANDPLPADAGLTPEQAGHVLGGEATMWGEWVSPQTIDSRIWPRTAAIAERLWSAATVRNEADMYRRLAIIDHRLAEAGLRQDDGPGEVARLLAGPAASSETVDAIVTLASALAPLQDYDRGKAQPQMNQLQPLTTLADVAVPDGEAARRFNREAAAYSRKQTAELRAGLLRQLEEWRRAAARAEAFARDTHRADLQGAADEVRQGCADAIDSISGAAARGSGVPAASSAGASGGTPLPPSALPVSGTFLAIEPGLRALGSFHPTPPS